MGAVQILTHSMVQSIEENSVRKGYDPRDFALVAEGGAGPLFAAQIALEVGTPVGARAELPGRDRGARPARDRHGLRVRLDGLPAALEARRGRAPGGVRGARGAGARAQLDEDGIPERPDRSIQRVADCRYLGPGLRAAGRLRLGRRSTTPGWRSSARTSTTSTSGSTRAASRSRTSRSRTSACAASACSRRSRRPSSRPGPSRPRTRSATRATPGSASAAASSPWRRASTTARRSGPANVLEGPAIVNQYDSTTVIPPGITAQVDRFGNIVIAVSRGSTPSNG